MYLISSHSAMYQRRQPGGRGCKKYFTNILSQNYFRPLTIKGPKREHFLSISCVFPLSSWALCFINTIG